MTTQHDSETPANGQQVITACAFIHHSFNGIEKLFLPRRALTKKFLPGVFELPGGHIEFGEDLIAGLKREVREEFEMEIVVGDPFAAFTYTNPVKSSHSLEIVYFASFLSPLEGIVLHPDDHAEFRWVAEAELTAIYSVQKTAEDPEFSIIRKGFALLRGESLHFT